MRFDGKLAEWNDDRGFGFITPQHGGDPVYVHISAFQSDGRRPRIGEVLSFEVEPTGDGKRRAVNVQRPGRKQLRTTHTSEPRDTGRRPRSTFAGVAAAALVVGGVYVYTQFSEGGTQPAVTDVAPSTPAPLYSAPATDAYRCDGRIQCSQMTSCDEAKFFLANCPGTKMDGNGDGIPCEQQWCGNGMRR